MVYSSHSLKNVIISILKTLETKILRRELAYSLTGIFNYYWFSSNQWILIKEAYDFMKKRVEGTSKNSNSVLNHNVSSLFRALQSLKTAINRGSLEYFYLIEFIKKNSTVDLWGNKTFFLSARLKSSFDWIQENIIGDMKEVFRIQVRGSPENL